MTLTENKMKYPPPHVRYLVSRNGWHFIATPCYGMHNPWWVSAICQSGPPETQREAEPLPMQETDKWVPLADILQALA